MNNDIIRGWLNKNPESACDDCISEKTGVSPRQQVNQLCRRLAEQTVCTRSKRKCPICSKAKLVTVLL